MIIITSADIYFGSVYFLSAPIWRKSLLCKFSSFLAFLSSECSVFTLALMTLDRFVCIIYPFSGYRLTVKSARIIMMLLWLVMCILSVISNLVPSDLPGFYGLFDVCVGLPLHAESEETGRLEFTENLYCTRSLIILKTRKRLNNLEQNRKRMVWQQKERVWMTPPWPNSTMDVIFKMNFGYWPR